MAVPKKRRSKMKKRTRRSVWMRQGQDEAKKALSMAKMVLSGKAEGFIFEEEDEEDEDEEEEETPGWKKELGDAALGPLDWLKWGLEVRW